MNSTKSRSADEQEELELEKQRLHVAEMERKANFEHTQTEVRRQKDQLQMLRRENKELRSTLSQTEKASKTRTGMQPGLSADDFQGRQKELIATKMFQSRRLLDSLKTANEEKEATIGTMNEKIEELSNEGKPILQDASPMMQKIRQLENRLDKSLIKHNEAMAVRRTYEQIVKRLRDERVGFDNQLAAIEKTLKSKEHDFQELQNMAHDAKHAKEFAQAEVNQFKASYAKEREQRTDDMEKRSKYVDKKMAQVINVEKQKQKQQDEQAANVKQEEEDRRKKETATAEDTFEIEVNKKTQEQNAEKYRKVKDAAHATNKYEIKEAYDALIATEDQLAHDLEAATARYEAKQREKQELRRKIDEGKYSGSGQLGSRRIIDEFEAHLSEAKAQLAKATKDYERVERISTGVRAGVEHLAIKLSKFHAENVAPPMKDDNLLIVMAHIDTKLTQLNETAPAEDANEEQLNAAEFDMPATNLRIEPSEAVEDEDETRRDAKDDEGDDDPHDRQQLKNMSVSAVEREAKKSRKLRRKKDDEV